MFEKTTGKGLGWASIGIGLSEIVAPRQIEKMMGIGNGQHTGILRVMGVREIMQGIDILSHEDLTPGVWARVAGDVLDVTLAGMAAKQTRNPGGMAATFGMLLGIGLMDMLTAKNLSEGTWRKSSSWFA
jgi:hypothetical protein